MNILEMLSDKSLQKYKLTVEELVRFYDGHDDEQYAIWRSLLERVWEEEKRRSQ